MYPEYFIDTVCITIIVAKKKKNRKLNRSKKLTLQTTNHKMSIKQLLCVLA